MEAADSAGVATEMATVRDEVERAVAMVMVEMEEATDGAGDRW